ncbi:MAG: hypothetical protein KatS3mg115_0942 [Candidatus Poribacteria bacterium]|nr:MAG: hypothetical protein KatS3mg115_0942 [Candidatus Poribacteria bacterium]
MLIRPQRLLYERLEVWEENRPIAGYVVDGEERPFLYPLFTPGGTLVTSYGKSHDPTGSHDHHKSVWIGHRDVDGCNFWELGECFIRHRGFLLLEDGPLFARVVQRTQWSSDGTERLRDRREWLFWRHQGAGRCVDLILTIQAPDERGVEIGRSPFGWLGVRVDPRLSVFDGGGEIQNSRGQRNEQEAHRQPAEWIDLSGPATPERWAGVTLMDHPDNPNHPTVWHCRNDGWAGSSVTAHEPIRLEAGRDANVALSALRPRRKRGGERGRTDLRGVLGAALGANRVRREDRLRIVTLCQRGKLPQKPIAQRRKVLVGHDLRPEP